MIDYETRINGIDVHAVFSEKNVEEIFDPLIDHLRDMQREKQQRILAMLAAPPASGKSTLCSFLSSRYPDLTILGMDGFHRPQDELLRTMTSRDGQTFPMVRIKGAPETFDLPKLQKYIERAASGEVFGWPAYDRLLHNPVEDAISVTGDLIILEGNYLLLNMDGWRELRKYADYTMRICADENMLRKRLIDRKIASGATPEEAEAFVEFSDLANARLCMTSTDTADLTMQIESDGSYTANPEDIRKFVKR